MYRKPVSNAGLVVRLAAALTIFVVLGHVYITLVNGLHVAGNALS